jgi:hypothetical protein
MFRSQARVSTAVAANQRTAKPSAILNLHERIENKLFLDRTRKDSNFKRPHIYATLFQIEKCCQTFSPLAKLFTEHTAPELLYLETRWASLVSFGLTTALLKDVLPVAGTCQRQ